MNVASAVAECPAGMSPPAGRPTATDAPWDELLRALAAVLDVREAFPRISQIVAPIVPHDLLMLTSHDRDGAVVVEAVSKETPLRGARCRGGGTRRADGELVAAVDLDRGADGVWPPELLNRIRAAGYASMCLVGRRVRDERVDLVFLSRRAGAFRGVDADAARRIADHIALGVSHGLLAEAAQYGVEARVRAERLERRVRSLGAAEPHPDAHDRAVGESAEWRGVLRKATQVAATDTTVLLSGESGTGKEVVARFIHRASARRCGPFIAINCAALPEQLLESELFGYERGAFTGAERAKPGQIELAAGGVLLLDEVSEMCRSVQAKFLRVLQEREFQRLGATRSQRANVRVVAATNRDLRGATERGEFREDLYYRLRVFDIALPPLRARTEDILPLSERFLKDIGASFGRPLAGLAPDGREALLRHDWPGNVRELRNALERAAILCEGGPIRAEHLELGAAPRPRPAATADLKTVERELIVQALEQCRGNKSQAARRLGLSRTQLYVRLRRYRLDQPPAA